MIDTAELKAHLDLPALAGQHTALKRKSNGEYCGPCPKCGGRDRFTVRQDWAWCRQCWPYDDGDPHDAIALVRWLQGCTFAEAVAMLQTTANLPGVHRRSETAGGRVIRAPHSPQTASPDALWQEHARAFLAWAQERLWRDGAALAYLRERGLWDQTIRQVGLGYNPRTLARGGSRWGVWLPRGWVIPWEMEGALWAIKIRRPAEDVGEGAKYVAVAGSRKAGVLYGLDDAHGHADVVICEGEFNALVLRQALHGLCGVVSVGDAGNLPGQAAMEALGRAARWWLAFDPDPAGEKGCARLGALSERARPLAWPWPGMDINDAALAGRDLAAWAIPQLGPRDPERRRAWCAHWLAQLWDAASDGASSEDQAPGPTWRAWSALLAAYESA